MKKKLRYIIPIIVVLLIGFMVYKISAKLSEKKKITEKIQTLPAFAFSKLNGEVFTDSELQQDKPVLITYFHPDCEICHSEFEAISKNIEKFNPFQLVFISHADTKAIVSLANEYKLTDRENVVFLEDKDLIFNQIFGKSGVPVSFIYNTQRKLIVQVKGQASIKELIKHLNQ